MKNFFKTDVLIAGSGCAGLYLAINLPRNKKITVITKAKAEECDSFLAQGGICMLKDEEDFDSFFEDTLKAGHYENDRKSVELMIKGSRDVLSDLLNCGVEFNKDQNGNLAFTKEGAHSKSRILFHKDVTGKEITSKLLSKARSLSNIEILESTTLLDIWEENDRCLGGVVKTSKGELLLIGANQTVLATGGIGGLYKHSTNYSHLTGDALAIALEHNIAIKDINYVQIHPTTLYSEDKDRSFLISESVRGEGARLYGKNKKPFTNELLPRDLLTKEITEQMKKEGSNFVWEDLSCIPKKELENHFPNIIEHCHQKGYDVFKECIPVVPAQHYFMGGVKIDYDGQTSLNKLYAVGETACNGVHGKNRLASNSLLESLVFAKRAALKIAEDTEELDITGLSLPCLKKYEDTKALENHYKQIVLEKIKENENV